MLGQNYPIYIVLMTYVLPGVKFELDSTIADANQVTTVSIWIDDLHDLVSTQSQHAQHGPKN